MMEKMGLLAGIVRNLRLVWRLMRDARVPLWLKSIPIGAAAYLLFPFDFVGDYIPGLGQLDDITVIVSGLRLFLSACPAALVEEHRRQMDAAEGDYIEAEYREINDPDVSLPRSDQGADAE